MKLLSMTARSLPFAVASLSIVMLAQPAVAEKPDSGGSVRILNGGGRGGLFDNLFGGGIRYRPRGDVPPLRKAAPRAYVPAARITGPSYYDYKADPLVRVDFA